ENHYMVKGNVISEKCQDAIPKIQITLRATDADGVDHDMPAITDENGNFSIDNWNVKTYSEYLLIAEDLDGTENKGDFEPSRQQIILGINDFENSKNENWNRYFESKKTYHFALKMRKDEPCK
ncbi:MAG TPA: radical SAM-associated putative lipoprotein, partial [Bacteroidales bacterium]|nr:radical SAM-associated putative lipoprotein [Bacteroidales bacterium]